MDFIHILNILVIITQALIPLASLHTFWKIIRGKSTQGYSSFPFITSLFEAMLWIYYGAVTSKAWRDQVVNGYVCAAEFTYIVIFLVYSPRQQQIWTSIKVARFTVMYIMIVIICNYMELGMRRVVAGIISSMFSVVMYGAPLSVMRAVISTRSVEFMPLPLSLCLFASGVVQTLDAIPQWDLYFWVLPMAGTLLGLIQIVLYIYIIVWNHITDRVAVRSSPATTPYESAVASPPTSYESAVSSEISSGSSTPSLEEIITDNYNSNNSSKSCT